MEKKLMCPRTELCCIYGAYVEATKDDTLGIILVEMIENTEFYSCHALEEVRKGAAAGELEPEFTQRLAGLTNCLLIDGANKIGVKHRPDF